MRQSDCVARRCAATGLLQRLGPLRTSCSPKAVQEWITSQKGVAVASVKMGRIFEVKGSAKAVGALLGTSFRMLSNPTTHQAAEY